MQPKAFPRLKESRLGSCNQRPQEIQFGEVQNLEGKFFLAKNAKSTRFQCYFFLTLGSHSSKKRIRATQMDALSLTDSPKNLNFFCFWHELHLEKVVNINSCCFLLFPRLSFNTVWICLPKQPYLTSEKVMLFPKLNFDVKDKQPGKK